MAQFISAQGWTLSDCRMENTLKGVGKKQGCGRSPDAPLGQLFECVDRTADGLRRDGRVGAL